METAPISRTGFNKLEAELKELQKELVEVRELVAEAREHGDLKENAEYLSGRERQGFIVGRIGELKGKINRSEIIDCTKADTSLANFGTFVTLLDLDTDKKIKYQLLGPDEADFAKGTISVHSPVGEAIEGRKLGEKFTVSIPRGDRNFEVLSIEPAEID